MRLRKIKTEISKAIQSAGNHDVKSQKEVNKKTEKTGRCRSRGKALCCWILMISLIGADGKGKNIYNNCT